MEKLGFVRRVAGQRKEIVRAPEGDDRLIIDVQRAEADREAIFLWALASADKKISHRWVVGFIAREVAAGSTRCEWCGGEGAEVHHIFPRELGGPDTPENLANVCKDCHEEISAIWRDEILWPLRSRYLPVNFQEIYAAMWGEGNRSGVLGRFRQRAERDPRYALTVVREFRARYAAEGYDALIAPLLDIVAEAYAEDFGPD